MVDRVRCPVCRNAGDTLDGKVVREYRPWLKNGRVLGRLTPLYTEELVCATCLARNVRTVLLVRRNGEWVQTWGVK